MTLTIKRLAIIIPHQKPGYRDASSRLSNLVRKSIRPRSSDNIYQREVTEALQARKEAAKC